MQNKEKVLLVDGMNLLNRCYYAIPKRSNSEGLVTNAMYGFIRTLINEQSIFKFSGIFVALDTPGSTDWRKEIYPEYKMNRKPKTEEEIEEKRVMNRQVKHLVHILQQANINVLYNKKYEADDIIASLASYLKEDYQVYILSADKDLIQLVEENVYLIRPGLATGTKNIVNLHTFQKFFPELEHPSQILDLKVLTGDKSDNIKGLTRIGDKTAYKLLKQYNTVDKLQNNIESLEEKFQKLLVREKEILERNKKIISLIKDIPIPEKRLAFSSPDFTNEKIKSLYGFYNINPWLD